MKKAKKICSKTLMAALSLLLLLLPGCKNQEEQEDFSSSSIVSEDPVEEETGDGLFHIGMIQYGEHPSYDGLREAFLMRLEEWGYDSNRVSVDYQNAQGDLAAAQSICREFTNAQVDLIVAVGAQAAAEAADYTVGTGIKVIFTAVEDPAAQLGMTDLNAPQGNMTGVSTSASHIAAATMALQSSPGISTMGILYNSEDTEATAKMEAVRHYYQEQGLTVVAQEVTAADSASAQMEALCAQAGAVFIPFDYAITSSMAEVVQVSMDSGTPIYSSERVWIENGALAAVGLDYSKAGLKTADMSIAVLEGRAVSELPVVTLSAGQTYINHNTLSALNITFPEEIMSAANFIIVG